MRRLAISIAATLSLTACAMNVDLNRRLDQVTRAVNIGDVAFGALVATGVVPPLLEARIRGYIQRAREAIALARAAIAAGDLVAAKAHADAASSAATSAEQELRNAAPPTAERQRALGEVAQLRREGEQLAAEARR